MTTPTALPILAPNDLAALSEFIRQMRERFSQKIIHVWLFGSKARGEKNPESDIDLLIVARDDEWEFEKSVTRIATQIDLAHNVVLSDHIVDLNRFKQMESRGEPLYHSIMREGVDLWTMELQPTI